MRVVVFVSLIVFGIGAEMTVALLVVVLDVHLVVAAAEILSEVPPSSSKRLLVLHFFLASAWQLLVEVDTWTDQH